jgi:DNA polymerase-3 subunit delta
LRQGKRAMHLLQEMLDGGQNELYVLSMVARQVRLVLSVKDLSEGRKLSSSEVGRDLHLRDFVVAKLLEQAKQFSMEALERAHRLVLGADQGIKTGAIAPRLALELLVIEMCSRRAG